MTCDERLPTTPGKIRPQKRLPRLLASCYPLTVAVPSDIIAAIATAPGAAAIGVVRLSGPGSHHLSLGLCRDLSGPPPERRLTLTWLVHPETRKPLDQALVAFFAPGASYTGEEAVEFYCHGGRITLERVFRACLEAGARAALPGEFTRRAVAAGRLDLLQAEAVALLAEAKTEAAADLALAGLAGEASRAVARVREDLLDALADCEAALDFAEEDGIEVSLDRVAALVRRTASEMNEWLEQARAARPCLDGVRIALVGPPNAGKSSLFNALLGWGRAIVHEEPGTTRDVVTEPLPLGGVPCVLMDTAGLRETGAAVEAEGVHRAVRAAREADVVVLVLDGSVAEISPNLPPADLWVASKSDIWKGQAPAFHCPRHMACLPTSARTGDGVARLREVLAGLARSRYEAGRTAGGLLAGERQVEAVAAACREARAALEALEREEPLEVAASHLRRAVEHLGEVTGANVTEEVLSRVFQRFCVGK